MKTNMLIFSLMISVAASAQTSIHANSSSQSELTVKKNQAKLSNESSNSQEASVKSNKISGETSLQQQAELNRKATANKSQGTDYQNNREMELKTEKGISATGKEKAALTASASRMATDKQGESKERANNAITTSEKLSGSEQGKAKAGVKTTEKMNESVQGNTKADIDASLAKSASIRKSANSTVSWSHSASVKNVSAVKARVRPHPVKVQTQIKSATAVRVR